MDELQTQNLNPNTSSLLLEYTSSLDYTVTGDNRLVTILCKKVDEIEKELYDLKVKKIIEETKFPPHILQQNNLFPKIKQKFKRGRGYRPILKSEIEEAKKHHVFCADQARYVGVGIETYKKYAIQHGLWEPHPYTKGKKQPHDPNKGKYPLNRILVGEFNGHHMVTDWMVKLKLLRAGIFPEYCNICSYDKRRITDKHVSLLLDHKDGDNKNYKLDNLQLLCWNCTIECGRGYLRRRINMFDPDWSDHMNQI